MGKDIDKVIGNDIVERYVNKIATRTRNLELDRLIRVAVSNRELWKLRLWAARGRN